MCLITNRQKPLVTDRDLIVCKNLVLKGNEWVTSIRHTPITNNLLESSIPVKPENDMIYGHHQIDGEGVHAYTNLANRVGFKAIIPKGTQFWISSGLTEIASTKLILTEEEYPGNTDLEYICDLLLKDVKVEYANDVIHINDYYINTKYLGKGASYHVLSKFGIKLFSVDELTEIFRYKIYINACLYKNKQNLIQGNWYWTKDIESLHSEFIQISREDQNFPNLILARAEY